MKLALGLLAIAACGESVPRELVVVAHQDDDLLFVRPDVHGPLTVVYVTAGDAGQGVARAEARARAARFAYGVELGSQAWTCAGERCVNGDVELVFLGYPDGGVAGENAGSLLHLWDGTVDEVATIDGARTYTRDALIGKVASLIEETRPSTIRTLEIAGTHGDDHNDHLLVGALVQLAFARTTSEAQLVSYRGYNINYDPPNVFDDAYDAGERMMRAYLACTSACGVCGETPCETLDDMRYVNFLHRSYPVEMTTADGELCTDGGCIRDVELGDDGLVHVGDTCLEVADDGRITRGACDPDPRRHFQLDEEGHLWAGIAPETSTLTDHERCVFFEAGVLQTGLCGASRDRRWWLR